MSSIVLTDARFYVDGRDLSADGNELAAAQQEVETKDFTTFGRTTRIYKPGLLKGSYSYKGFQQYGTLLVDAILQAKLGSSGVPILAAAEGGDRGERSYFFRGLQSKYDSISGKIGEPLMFSIEGVPDGGYPIVGGPILEDGKTVQTASGSGVPWPSGAVSATQKLYAIVQLLALDAGTVTIKVCSGPLSIAQPNEITFAAQGAMGGLYLVPIPGPNTDTWWSAAWTFAGGAALARFVVAMAIF